jgi:transglutaminase-like putative cysteine protease
VPYAPASVTGLVGQWSWEPDALSIRSDSSNARNQVYEVASVQVAPSVDELVAAGTTVEPGLDRYLQLPSDLPAVVATTAAQVVAGATTNYAKAIALQAFFTGGQFTYSEDAPVKKGYDGSGASVLAAFLQAKSGYCVHFSSAMAAMARTLGIPARVAVGFTPGEAVSTTDGGDPEYRVTTHDLHAWPELYFAGIGWVRFEPTPGRGVTPAFAPLAVDDPSTPNVDESKPTPATAAPTADPSAAPSAKDAELPTATATATAIGTDATSAPVPPLALLIPLAALLAAPFTVRTLRRQRRIGMLRGGSALAGWQELRDTADDLGLRTSDGRTPRQLADDLSGHLDDGAAAALARLRAALESEAFADGATRPAAEDLSAVLGGLRRDAGLARRIAAATLPRSLFERWIPQPQATGTDPQ